MLCEITNKHSCFICVNQRNLRVHFTLRYLYFLLISQVFYSYDKIRINDYFILFGLFGRNAWNKQASIITTAAPNRLSHKYGIQSILQTKTTMVCVIIAAENTALPRTNLKKKANKNTPNIFP